MKNDLTISPRIIIVLRRMIVFLLLVVLSSQYYAQNYKFETITTDEGLSQNFVYSIFQDSRHFLWIGTADGLNRYDGNGFKVYNSTSENPGNISGHHFSSIVEDKEGNLWVGSYGGGLNKYIRKTESFENIKPDSMKSSYQISDRITYLLIDRNNNLWIASESGLSRLSLSTGKIRYFKADYSNPDCLCNERVYTLYEDSDGKIWAGTWAGLSIYDPNTDKFTSLLKKEKDPRLICNDFIHRIYKDKRKNLWIGTSQGLYLFNRKDNSFKKFKSDPKNPGSINDEAIQDILEDSHGNLWIATFYGGLNLYDRDKNVFHHYKHNPFDPTSINSNVIQCLYEDRSGILWVGTMDGGVCKLDFRKAQFKNYKAEPNSPSSISNNHVSSILVESENSIWVGTLGGGINNLVRKDGTERFTRAIHKSLESSPIANNLIYSIYPDNENNLWFGTEGGLAKFNKLTGNFKLYNTHTNSSMINNIVFKIMQDHSGKLWIGTYGGGISYLDRKTDRFVNYTHDPQNPNSIAINIVRYIFEDSQKRMWVCTENGLDLFDREKNRFIHFRNDQKDANTIIDNKVMLIFESSKKELWIGTPFGLCKVIEKADNPAKIKFLRFTCKNGLAGNSIQGIQEDNKGNLWISTNDGISKFNPVNNKFNNFDVSDGLLSNEFYVTAAAKIHETGELIYGGNKGLVVFDPNSIRSDEFVPPVVITNLRIGKKLVPINQEFGGNLILNQSITETKTINLNYDQTEISLEVAALHFANPKDNKFKYKMEGLDDDWTDLGRRRFISFTNLEPGKYIFRLKTANHSGVWNEKGLSLQINIKPPFWGTFLFKTFAILAGLGFIILAYKFKTHSIQKRSHELQEEVNRRTGELINTNKQLQDEVIERITIEEKLRKAKESAENANKSKSEFLANMSHELRTPLNAILGYTQIMRKHPDISDKHKDQLLVIQQSGEHLLTLINDILDLRRIEMKREAVNQSEMNLHTLIKEVVDTIDIKAIEKQLSFEHYEDPCTPEYVIGDAKKVKQILLNLLGNAVKYTNSGFVRLKVSCLNTESGPLSEASAKIKKIQFIVEDSGIGIQGDKYGEIFQPFRTKENPQDNIDSHGLGLAISKRLIEILGGQLMFNSEVEKGTTFSFEIEFETIENIGNKKEEIENEILDYVGERKKILIVDDNSTNRSMFNAVLEPLGFIIKDTDNGLDALEFVKKFNPDLILLDLLMPAMDGQLFIQEFRNKYEATNPSKIIGVSAAIADKDRIETFSKLCDDFLAKPVDINQLLERIQKLLKLVWIIKKSSSNVNKSGMALPGKNVLAEIIHSVENGDYSTLQKILKDLSTKEEYSMFNEKLKELSKNFDEEGILKLCKNQIEFQE